MARNEEKAMAMLNRWVKMKREINFKKTEKDESQRPLDAKEIRNLTEAEAWRATVVKEIVKKVSEIQNGSLGEFRIREINDKINELLTVKDQWEAQIMSLGGQDYQTISKQENRDSFEGGVCLPGAEGYKYFGAAKNLPKVRELLETQQQLLWQPPKSNKQDLERKVNHFYLGLVRTQDSSSAALALRELEQREAEAEAELRNDDAALDLHDKFVAKKRRRIELMQTAEKDVRLSSLDLSSFRSLFEFQPKGSTQTTLQKSNEERIERVAAKIQTEGKVAQTTEELLQKLQEKKKKLLMSKYASKDLADEQMNPVERIDRE